jgi:predicted alpha-1,6-mannanase (GH76 family)
MIHLFRFDNASVAHHEAAGLRSLQRPDSSLRFAAFPHLKTLKCIRAAILVMAVCCFSSCLKQKDDNPQQPGGGGNGTLTFKWPDIADSAQASMNFYWQPLGKYFSSTNNSSSWINYWPTAHALDVLVDLYLRKPSVSIRTRMEETVAGLKVKNGNTFINFYYDDMEWMALACLRAFNATNDTQYRDIAQLLWVDIKNGWSSDLGGGIWWRKDNSSKNAPSNLPAAILAARLYKKFGNAADLNWAKQIYQWQKTVLYEPNSGWVYDNITSAGVKNTTWKFTYNQGTFIGAALELYQITNESAYLDDALKAADYALQSGQLTDVGNGVLKDEGGGDGGLFKGVFVRYFNRLIVDGNIASGKKTQYVNFMKANAEKLWSAGVDKNLLLFGSSWTAKPGNTNDFTNQLSGIMLFEALAELKGLGLVN